MEYTQLVNYKTESPNSSIMTIVLEELAKSDLQSADPTINSRKPTITKITEPTPGLPTFSILETKKHDQTILNDSMVFV